jgi:uncharacterized protein with LGFP repeats
MPSARRSDRRPATVWGTLGGACAAILVPALVATTAGAIPPGPSPAVVAAAGPTAVAPDVMQPTVSEVPLPGGVDPVVLAAAPDPHVHESPGPVAAQSVESVDTMTAVAASVPLANPAELLGVVADEPFAVGTRILLRVREALGWSGWSDLHVDPGHGPDPGSPEARGARSGSDPLLAQDAVEVQVRIDTPDGEVPAGTSLTVVDAPAAPSDAAPAAMAQAASVAQPAILTRAQWGADESWRSRGPLYTSDVQAGFVHHTASTSNYSPEQAAAQVRAIYSYHTRSLGHSDIDYNFVVDRFGRLYEGRAGGMDKPVLGAHTAGFNEHTFAVVALGNFETFRPSATDMSAIRGSIAKLFAWKLGLHGVNPGSTARLVSAGYKKATRYPAGTVAEIPAISSHQTVNFTACPGTHLQAQLPAIRELAVRHSVVVLSAPYATPKEVPAGSGRAINLTAVAKRALSWTIEVLSPCSDTPVRTFRGKLSGPGRFSVQWDQRDSSGALVPPAQYEVRVWGTDPAGSRITGMSSSVGVTPAPGGAWGPCAGTSRVVGRSLAETSVLWGRLTAPAAMTVVLSGYGTETDVRAAGLAGAALARSMDAPLLLTSPTALDPAIATELRLRLANEVLVVGGQGVVSDRVLAAVRDLGARVTRIAGASPAGTALAVAARMRPDTPAVLVSPMGSPAHAVVGAALAARRGWPLLMDADSALPTTVRRALASRPSVTVVASSSLSDQTVAAALPDTPWRRLRGVDAAGASAVVAREFPASTGSANLLPDDSDAWGTAALSASAGVPLLITAGSGLSASVADLIRERPALRGATASVSDYWLSDRVLGSASRLLQGQPWAPPAVNPGLAPARTFRVGPADAAPEPVRRGQTLRISATVAVESGTGPVAVPAGVPFTIQFMARGRTWYTRVATGVTGKGFASARVTATTSGRWRIVVGAGVSASDYVSVRG